ncbi:catenin [Aphelenchoides avenae]|nr:catenin [Aphelenchus avenae]
MEPSVYKPHIHRPKLEELVELIATGAANIADLDNTRPNRRDHIIAGVNNLREALQDLLTQYENNIGKHEPTEELDLSTVHLAHKIKDLRRHLRRAIVDHVSDAFVDTSTPLMLLVKAAREGDVQGTHAASRAFMAHANNLVDVSRLVCEMSNDVEGVRLTRYAAQLCELLAPQVVNAAQLLCEKKDSPVLQDNMRVFEEAWLDRVKVLTMATDALVSVEDFLAVAEAHLEEDIKQAIKAILDKNDETLDNAAGCIRLRAKRICDVVDGEMDQLPPTQYSENVKQASRRLRDGALHSFAREAERLVSEIEVSNARSEPRDTQQDVDRMITAGTSVHNSVNEIRQALLMNRNPEDVDSDNEYEEGAQ